MAAGALAEFIDELVYQLLLTNRVLSRNLAISNCNFRAILFLEHTEGASVRQVAMFLGVTLPRASNVVDDLVKRELVRRETSQDRRRASLHLTESGKTVVDNLHQIHAEVAKRLLLNLPETDQRSLETAMQHCTVALRSNI